MGASDERFTDKGTNAICYDAFVTSQTTLSKEELREKKVEKNKPLMAHQTHVPKVRFAQSSRKPEEYFYVPSELPQHTQC